METLKNVGKGFMVLGIVGVLLALASPAIATMVSPILSESMRTFATETATKLSANALWEGAFFGGFGALHAAVVPMMDWVFGDKKEAAAAAPVKVASCSGHGHGVNITNLQMQPDVDVAVEAGTNHHTQMLDVQRAEKATQLQLVK